MKLQMAIEGARQAAMALSPWDRIGVITFADDSTLDITPRSARGAGSIPMWLSTVEAGGRGTNIYGRSSSRRECSRARSRRSCTSSCSRTDASIRTARSSGRW